MFRWGRTFCSLLKVLQFSSLFKMMREQYQSQFYILVHIFCLTQPPYLLHPIRSFIFTPVIMAERYFGKQLPKVGSTLVKWLAHLPCNSRVPGLNHTCSPCTFMGFLRVLQFLPTLQRYVATLINACLNWP